MNPDAFSRRRFALLAASLFTLRSRLGWATEADDRAARVVYVQPLAPMPSDAEIACVEQALRGFYDTRVSVLSAIPMPKGAFYAPRQRYRADNVLTALDRLLPERGLRILGVTAADISTTKGNVFDWGIMGLARMPGRSCVVSSFRCKRRATGPDNATIRLAKTAVHELGHTFGLEHCPTLGCLLEDAGGSVLTTDREYDLCTVCRTKLASAAVVRETRAIPWPKPT